MLQEFIELLSEELVLFRQALETEQGKRKFILAANGQKLRELTDKSEHLITQIDLLEEKRNKVLENIYSKLAGGDTLSVQELHISRIIQIAESQKLHATKPLKATVHEYRNTVQDLKKEIEENKQLLDRATGSIHRLLSGLAKDPEKKYEPRSQAQTKNRRNTGESVLLNANA